MSISSAFFSALLLSVASASAAVACAAPVEAPADGKGASTKKPASDKDGTDPEEAAKPPTSTSPPASGAPSGSPSTTPPGGMPSEAEQKQADACFEQCIAADPKAKQIDQQDMACLEKCGQNDQACADKCFQASEPLCKSAPASCQLLGSCEDKCFAGAGGGSGSGG